MPMRLATMAVLAAMTAAPAVAQEYVIPQIWGNGLLGQSAMTHTRETLLNDDDDRSDRREDRRAETRECSADALPAHERRALEREYMRRMRSDGRASADLWVRDQGRQFREKLEREGVC